MRQKALPPGAKVRGCRLAHSLLKAGGWHRAPSTGARSCTPIARAGGGKINQNLNSYFTSLFANEIFRRHNVRLLRKQYCFRRKQPTNYIHSHARLKLLYMCDIFCYPLIFVKCLKNCYKEAPFFYKMKHMTTHSQSRCEALLFLLNASK